MRSGRKENFSELAKCSDIAFTSQPGFMDFGFSNLYKKILAIKKMLAIPTTITALLIDHKKQSQFVNLPESIDLGSKANITAE